MPRHNSNYRSANKETRFERQKKLPEDNIHNRYSVAKLISNKVTKKKNSQCFIAAFNQYSPRNFLTFFDISLEESVNGRGQTCTVTLMGHFAPNSEKMRHSTLLCIDVVYVTFNSVGTCRAFVSVLDF